jgi:hypothetical protein
MSADAARQRTLLMDLARVFWDYIDVPEVSTLAAATRQLRPRTPVTTTALGLAGAAATVRPARAYGSPRRP